MSLTQFSIAFALTAGLGACIWLLKLVLVRIMRDREATAGASGARDADRA